MHPIMWNLPFMGISIKSYGLMMMLGFFAATWWAMYRAQKVKADPDVILNLGFISLVCGIAGARLLYVYQYWNQDFATQPNPLYAIIDITKGGLVFYGGFLVAVIGALVYLTWAKHSIRLYLDILTPSLMLGLAFGRMGCFLNGCCWGAPTDVPWAITFPYGSPPYNEQRNKSLIDAPQQLLVPDPRYWGAQLVMDRDHVHASPDVLSAPQEKLNRLQQDLDSARRTGASTETISHLTQQVETAKKDLEQTRKEYYDLYYAYQKFGTTPSEITAIAAQHRSMHIHPTQIYAIVDALLLALVLHAVFMRRKQQGMVFGLVFILYGAGRFLEEMVRGDNPRDMFIGPFAFTMSQMISIYTAIFAIFYLIIIYRLPAVPPTAVRTIPAEPKVPAPASK